jgi:hypothetical protein
VLIRVDSWLKIYIFRLLSRLENAVERRFRRPAKSVETTFGERFFSVLLLPQPFPKNRVSYLLR